MILDRQSSCEVILALKPGLSSPLHFQLTLVLRFEVCAILNEDHMCSCNYIPGPYFKET